MLHRKNYQDTLKFVPNTVIGGTIELSTLGMEWAYFSCRREGSEYLWPREWSIIDYVVSLFKIFGACPLTSGFVI